MTSGLKDASEILGRKLCEKGLKVMTAESCTAGLICTTLGAVKDSMQFFSGGVITYTEETKMLILDVCKETLRVYTAVSRETVVEMAEGAAKLMPGNVTLAISGYAGPEGGQDGTPAGTVWFAWRLPSGLCHSEKHVFSGECELVISSASYMAISRLAEILDYE